MSKLLRPEELPASGTAFNLADLERQGELLVARAKSRAAEILAAAHQESERVSAQARKDGFETGKTEGLALGREEGIKAGREAALAETRQATATLEKSLSSLVAELASRRDVLVKQAERDLLRLAVAVAARIVRRELALDSEAVQRALVEAVRLAAERSRIAVRVNPADLAAAGAVHDELIRSFADIQDVKFIGDETIERGGCRVLTEAGESDMRVATQLERLEQLLIGEADIDAGTHPDGPKEDGR